MPGKKLKLIPVIISLIVSLCSSAFAAAPSSGTIVTAEALWLDSYTSYQEMLEAADLVVSGTIDSQFTEIRCDMVFTNSIISINNMYKGDCASSEYAKVLQTGGIYGSISTPSFEDAPVLKADETEYLLFLNYVNDSAYGEYYLILGGGAGIVDCSARSDTVNLNSSNFDDFIAELDQEDTAVPSAGSSQSNTTGGYFYTKTPKVYYRTTLSSTMKSFVKSGILSWNNGTSITGATIYTTTSASSADITISAGEYGETGWAGYTWRYDADGNDAGEVNCYASAYIGLNTSFLSSSSSNWQLVAMHEMGHVFGLSHTDTGSSVMYTDYYSLVSSGLTAPTTADYNAVKSAYDGGGL